MGCTQHLQVHTQEALLWGAPGIMLLSSCCMTSNCSLNGKSKWRHDADIVFCCCQLQIIAINKIYLEVNTDPEFIAQHMLFKHCTRLVYVFREVYCRLIALDVAHFKAADITGV